MSNGDRDAALIRSVDRAMAILDVLADGGPQAGAEVARELGVHRSTALRLLATLERRGLVERDQRTAKYRLGGRLVQLASAVRGEADLRLAARPVCATLARAVGETVTLDVLDGNEIVPVEQASGSTSVVSVSWLGTRSPAHCTASGKVILAFGPDEVRLRFLARPLERRTPHTIAGRAELEAQLSGARAMGYARTDEELEVGLSAIAAPVRGQGGDVVGAIDVSGPAHRFGQSESVEIASRCMEAAGDLSRRLGFRHPKS
jgi:DNA-binding IclR family transcriptional regulator